MFHVNVFAFLLCTVLFNVYHDANISDYRVSLAYLQKFASALVNASKHCHEGTVKLLLDAGADVNERIRVSTMWCGVALVKPRGVPVA